MRRVLIAPLILALGLPVHAEMDIEPISHSRCSLWSSPKNSSGETGCLEIKWGFIQTSQPESKANKNIQEGLNKLINSKEYKQAIKYFNKAISKNKKDFKAYNYRGLAKYKMNDIEGAIDDFNKSIFINEKYDQPYYNLGNIGYHLGHNYLRSDAYDSAYDLYTKAIEKNKKKAIYYSARAMAGMKTDMKNVCKDLKKGYALGDKRSISKSDISFWCNL